ncbi:queuosine precursor transporter [Actinomycetaceae bacterium WB03_NA08]|uniref:Probable queuosine precursor transporter n=1 Tax=Scrofimicrobium canadense TaxID=2652290 RepID=A0A6N7VQC4_9ACTO|nr:queuosine precursor transporter [Scrofimicrobium canadense]MSS83944.1 queuosine precursor transporter [Scrofimicrobium canadense]
MSKSNPRLYDLIAISFVAFLLIANVAATKLFSIGSLIFDGGAVLFPLTYVLGDVLAEVYGFARARRVIVIGFVMSAVASLTFFVVQLLPPAPGYENQEAFEAILGFVPRIVLASLVAYLVGQLLNAYVLVSIKKRWGERRLWVRLLGSSIVGEAADTAIFCTIAFYGVLTGWDFVNYLVVGYAYKMLVEILFLPLLYPAIAAVRKRELSYDK